jgi:hypothetical protein
MLRETEFNASRSANETIGNDLKTQTRNLALEVQLSSMQPLLQSSAVQRLGRITFLGILSPRFGKLTGCPLFRYRRRPADDGTRLDHTMAVSSLAFKICLQVGLPEDVCRYATVWGLLHDIATWPLSHTGEAAFSNVTHVRSRRLREMMIQGDPRLPEFLTVRKALGELAIKRERLLSLFEKESPPHDRDFAHLWRIIHSPLTPDSLEGIWRCSRSFGVKLKSPDAWVQVFKPGHLFSPYVHGQGSIDAEKFWRKKSYIYDHFINRPDVVAFESSWSEAMQKKFGSLSLSESLLLNEQTIIRTILNNGVTPTSNIVRYKAPHLYTVHPGERQSKELSLEDIGRMFLKQLKI